MIHKKIIGIILYNFSRIHCYRSVSYTHLDVYKRQTYAQANHIESVKSLLDENTCAVFIEMIQGEGGVMPLEPHFVKELEKLCKKHDVLLMIDEVQTGMGRTGTLFCYEQYRCV